MADYQIVSGDAGKVITVDSFMGPTYIQLLAPTAGFNITIKDSAGSASPANPIIIQRNSSSDMIDGEVNDDIIVSPFGAISYVSDGTQWFRVSSFLATLGSGTAVFGGGLNGSATNGISSLTMSTLGNAVSFGQLITALGGLGACASSTRGLFMGGYPSGASTVNTIQYITFSTASNATSFGTLTESEFGGGCCSSSTRGLRGGGRPLGYSSVIDYVTIASAGNATSFGNLTQARDYINDSGFSSPTIGLWAGGGPSNYTIIDYVTIATTGNAASFGSLSTGKQGVGCCANPVRGIMAGGYNGSYLGNIEYVTMATTGNATSFGNMVVVAELSAAAANSTIGIIGGGQTTGSVDKQTIEYVTIATTGNAQNFGNMASVNNKSWAAACSNSHGGLGG